MKTAIQVNGLTKIYPSQNGRKALEGLKLSVKEGELFGLVGPDGAGKTTTLRILSTVLLQSTGDVLIGGFNTRNQAEQARLHLGYMPQNFSLYPDLSVRENLGFFADLNQVSSRQKKTRIAELLSFSRLEQFQDRKAGQLSGGMKKKLALSCALVHDPQILLLDEPSTGVDPVSRRELWVILADLVKRGITILLSTPYMDEAERCSRVGVLYQGRILAEGEPRQLTGDLPFDVLEVKAKPRKAIRQIVSEQPDLLSWRPVGDRLRMTISQGRGLLKQVQRQMSKKLAKRNIQGVRFKEAQKTMEDVFVYMVDQDTVPHA